ncbi:MAG: hybrid sensor histidine kinase/response regulator [Deltaproteobacteria bacterium]|nr:hybrid sensor histidine kinase/response regulator [Deltaproteobacteria bacterium]
MPPQVASAVLLVDDDQANLDVLRSFLDVDLQVFEANSADDALAYLDRPELDVIVTDQRMPGMTGIELLRVARDRRPDLAGIVLTAYTDTPALMAAINEAGAFRFLRKPWQPADVLQAVRDAREFVAQRRLIHRLVGELRQRNTELAGAMAELREAQARLLEMERLATTGRLAAGIAHDLSNAINGLVLIEHEARDRAVDGDLLEVVQLGLAGARNLLSSRETLGMFARQRRLSMAIDRFDMAQAARDALGVLRLDLAFRRRQQVVVLPEAPLPPVVGDRQKVVQAVVNLLRNAVQATSDGQRVQIEVALGSDGWVELAVEDDGPGLDPEVRENLFDAFVSTKGEGGMGLGLYMANLIAAHHSGTLTCLAAAGGGARFVMRLPTVAAAPAGA